MKYLFTIIFLLPVISIYAQNNLKPNIIFIFADDLGYGDIGCYGQQKIETPNIDQLAQKGMKFTQFYSGSTVCAPARSSFLTGLHTGHTPIRGNKPFAPEGQTPLPDSIITFANILQQNGYATAAFGKWGLGFINNSGDPNKKGFDRFYGYNCQSLAHDYYPPYIWDNHDKVDLSVNKTKDSIYSASLIHDQTIGYIKQQSSAKPFFIYLPYTLPHGDVIGPHDELYNYYVKKFNEQPLTGKDLRTRAHNMIPEPYPHAQFAAMIGRLDKFVGEVVKTVEEKGLAENTLIIFTSDNGPHKENGGDPEFFNSNGIYRGIKRDLYEGGIRVPFVAYWPGRIKPKVESHQAALWDMSPTFLQLAGIPNKKKVDGISIAPLLLNNARQEPHEYFYWEFHENDGRQAILSGKWKAIKLGVSKIADPPIELYDLVNDPQEMNNVAATNPSIIKKMRDLFSKEHVYDPAWPLLYTEVKK
ncbi:MAG TPA: arylsulfatase [Chitinophagaceae bacterium]